jgi:hypothetical protein
LEERNKQIEIMKTEITKNEWYNILATEYKKNEWLLNYNLLKSESAYNQCCFEIQSELKKKYIIK